MAWLTVYNLVQFLCFATIFGKLVICIWKNKHGELDAYRPREDRLEARDVVFSLIQHCLTVNNAVTTSKRPRVLAGFDHFCTVLSIMYFFRMMPRLKNSYGWIIDCCCSLLFSKIKT